MKKKSASHQICFHLKFLMPSNIEVRYLINRLDEREAPGSRSFFTEIITSISDIKFAKDGRYLLSRDYMTLKVHSPYYSWVICLVSLHLCNPLSQCHFGIHKMNKIK